MLRGKKLTAGLSGIGGVVGDEKFVGIAEQVDLVVFKIAEIQPGYAFENSRQACVFIFDGIAEAVAVVSKSANRPLMSCSDG